MRKKILIATVIALMPFGASLAMAQEQTPPDTSVRALEVPQDVRPYQLQRNYDAPVMEGRSVYEQRPAALLPPAIDNEAR